MKKFFFGVGLLAFCFALIAPAAFAQTATEFKLCTGGENKNYWKSGNILRDNVKRDLNIVVQTSDGSVENMERLLSNAGVSNHCDGAFVQADAYLMYEEKNPNLSNLLRRSGVLYPEWMHVLCNKNSGIENINELTEKNSIGVGPKSSGHNLTWQALKTGARSGWFSSEKTYDRVKVIDANDFVEMSNANEDNNACIMIMSSFGSSAITEDAAQFPNLKLINTDDTDILAKKDKSGDDVYVVGEIPSGQYPNSLPEGTLWGTNSVEVIGVNAIFVVNREWSEANRSQYEKLVRGFVASKSAINQLVQPVN